jgi:hypothetical protein
MNQSKQYVYGQVTIYPYSREMVKDHILLIMPISKMDHQLKVVKDMIIMVMEDMVITNNHNMNIHAVKNVLCALEVPSVAAVYSIASLDRNDLIKPSFYLLIFNFLHSYILFFKQTSKFINRGSI